MPAHRLQRLTALSAIVFVGLAPSAPAGASRGAQSGPSADYTFTLIANSDDQFLRGETGCPAINNDGAVAFRARPEAGDQQVYVGTGGALAVIADQGDDGLQHIERSVSINDKGDVAFVATLPDGSRAVLRGDGSVLRKIMMTNDQPYEAFARSVAVDATGRVFAKARLDDGDFGLFSARKRSQQTTHFLASETDFDGDLSGVSVRGKRVAYVERIDGGTYGVFAQRGDTITRIADNAGPFLQVVDPSIGRAGRVGLHALLDGGGEALVSGRGGPLKTIADSSGPFHSFGLGSPALNGHGQAVFIANLDDGSSYNLYNGPNPATDEIIGSGDPLFGSQIVHVDTCGQGLNDHGQVAFVVRLTDGRDVIGRADPTG